MQRITTREPDEKQLSVAIESILGAIPADFREEVQAQLDEIGYEREETAPWTDPKAAETSDNGENKA